MREVHCCGAISSADHEPDLTYIELVRSLANDLPNGRHGSQRVEKEIEIMSAQQQFNAVPSFGANGARIDELELSMAARRARAKLVYDAVQALVARVKAWNERRQTFAELDGLDDRTLADIGINRAEIGQIAAGHYVRDGYAPFDGSAVPAAHAANAVHAAPAARVA
jgi:uncharacterized protein YjiS (DUF1127 family)